MKDISKSFDTKSGSTELFNGVNINFCSSTSYALIGESGVGKSTLLHIASGLEKPSSGEVFFGEKSFWRLKASDQSFLRLNETAMIFQQYNLIPCLNVRENIEFQSKINNKYDREYISNIINDLQLCRLLEEWPENLSGGEQQMLAIGRALMSEPEYLLLDEPSLGLAPKLVDQIAELIQEINKQGVTVLLVEQNANMALNISDHGYIMETGNIVMDNDSKKLLNDEDVREFYLGLNAEGTKRKSFRDVKHYKRKKRWLS